MALSAGYMLEAQQAREEPSMLLLPCDKDWRQRSDGETTAQHVKDIDEVSDCSSDLTLGMEDPEELEDEEPQDDEEQRQKVPLRLLAVQQAVESDDDDDDEECLARLKLAMRGLAKAK
eukprot:TRINITY_DN91159_c0_g1_i1.p1 TRINITY_DN91159_c0_g1~~TRINITY_DN91159_c0_g1_i1.p1  ORF type:complete len:118 (-),score=46.59 TRINITY_DN91159_c0_g1_i1:142-495(-)